MRVRYAPGEVVRETPRKFLLDANEASWLVVVFEHGRLRGVLFLWDRGMCDYLFGQKTYGAFAWTAVAPEEQTKKRSCRMLIRHGQGDALATYLAELPRQPARMGASRGRC